MRKACSIQGSGATAQDEAMREVAEGLFLDLLNETDESAEALFQRLARYADGDTSPGQERDLVEAEIAEDPDIAALAADLQEMRGAVRQSERRSWLVAVLDRGAATARSRAGRWVLPAAAALGTIVVGGSLLLSPRPRVADQLPTAELVTAGEVGGDQEIFADGFEAGGPSQWQVGSEAWPEG